MFLKVTLMKQYICKKNFITNRYCITCKISYIDAIIGHLIYVIMCFLSVCQMLLKHTLNLALVGGSCIIIATKDFLNY